MNEEQIFAEAIEKAAAERAEYLDRVCADAPDRRVKVEELLAAHENPDRFLENPVADLTESLGTGPLPEKPGTRIGPYKLREKLGEGGMGVVWAAEQVESVHRKVALKVIKPGMDSEAVIARFEAERQAVALMDHPNIAHILDAGTTDQGRPYFVMELIRGIPITEYCDTNKLSIPERLELFTQVCKAVQHAHQKGIIHRDIKPSNILVTLHDGAPVPKVIDFGVAKALNQKLTDKTIYTRVHQAIGTLAYMSPEQAELSGLDVDTRADVYGLGVLLYELLTGTTPFEQRRLHKAAYQEACRIIRDEEPPRPSVRLSTLGETATAVSASRRSDPAKLGSMFRGELDWIVMKALEKDRTRRYETAKDVATDIRRYLDDEPVSAKPPSFRYRFTKTVRRNRATAATVAVVLSCLLLGILATSWMAYETRQTLARLASSLFEQAVTAALAGDTDKARLALAFAEDAGASKTQILIIHGLIALNEGHNDIAISYADEAIDLDHSSIAARSLRTVACIWAGYDDLGELELEKLRDRRPESDTDRLLMAYALLGSDPDRAQQLVSESPAIERSPVGLLIRAFANLIKAEDSRDAARAEQAIRDFGYVQFLFHDNRASLGFRLLAYASAIRIAQSEGRPEDVERYREEGRRVAKQLLPASSDYPAGAWSCHQFYVAAGDSREAADAIRRVGQHPGSYSWFLAADMLKRYGDDALTEFDRVMADGHTDSKYVELARAYLMGNSPNRHADIPSLVGDLCDDESPFLRRHAILALCLCGDEAKVREAARKTPNDIQGLWNDRECLNFLAEANEPGSEERLLELAGESESAKSNAFLTLAMLRLARGDKAGAIDFFGKCNATQAVGFFDYEWSRGFHSWLSGSESSIPDADDENGKSP